MCSVAKQKPENKYTGTCLRDNGCNRRTFNTHSKNKDENRVQNNVHNCTDNGGQHRFICKTLTGDELIKSRRQNRKNSSRNIKGKITVRIWEGLFTGTKKHQHRFAESNCQCSKDSGQYQKHYKTVCQDIFRTFLVLLTHAHCQKRCSADSDQKCKGGNQRYNWSADSCSRQSNFSDILDVSDVHSVNDTVKDVDKLCKHRRNCKSFYKLFNVIFSKIILFSNHSSPPLTGQIFS